MAFGCAVPRWHVLQVMTWRPAKFVLLMEFTINIILRAVCFSAFSSAYRAQSEALSSMWQSVQFNPVDAEKKPIVPMN